jgi:acetyl esterase/lipase
MTRSTHTYGSHPSQLGELHLPSGAGPHPVCVVVHGGYWRAQYDRSLMTGLCDDLAAHGLAAWNLEYRRVGGGGGWPDTLLDVAAGVDSLAALEAPLDLARVVAIGHSAGGQLASGRPRVRPCRPMRPARRLASRSGLPSRRQAFST